MSDDSENEGTSSAADSDDNEDHEEQGADIDDDEQPAALPSSNNNNHNEDDDSDDEPPQQRSQSMIIKIENIDDIGHHSGSDFETEDEDDDDHRAHDADDEFLSDAALHSRQGSIHERKHSLINEKQMIEEKLRQMTQSAVLDEFTEYDRINEDKQIFGDLFDKIDPDDNGDVDEKEWIAGLHRLEVNIPVHDMSKLFKLMNGDNAGYIDRQDWITFCMTSYQTTELQRIQDCVLTKIKGHSRMPSNMVMHAQNAGQWTKSQVSSMQLEMQNAAMQMGTQLHEKVQAEEQFYEDIESAQAKDPDFGKPDRASDWTPPEVAWWLDSIELSQYARKFVDEPVDGNILLNDVDRRLLQQDMGVKPVHVGKILREINLLRELNQSLLSSPYKDWNELERENEALQEKLMAAQQQIKELQNENSVLKLKNMSSANLFAIKNPYNASLVEMPSLAEIENDGDDVENGMDDGQITTGVGMGLGLSDLSMVDNMTDMYSGDPYAKIKVLHSEIEFLRKSKIAFAEKTAIELSNMRKIVKILSGEYQTLQTPMYERFKFNPFDSLIRYAGYKPANS